MADELVVAGVVRMMAEHAFPQDQVLADAVVSVAVKAYWSGASTSEACRAGERCLAAHVRGAAAPPAAGRRMDQVA